MTNSTRKIFEAQEPYIGVRHERLSPVGPRGKMKWIDAGGGGDLFDPEEKDKKILAEYGSPVIVYPGGLIVPIKTDPNIKTT